MLQNNLTKIFAWKYSKKFLTLLLIFGLFLTWQIWSKKITNNLFNEYSNQESKILFDRQGKLLQIKPNDFGYYNQFLSSPPRNFTKNLLKKEDRFFYWHPGINFISMARDAGRWLIAGHRGGSSTITQQLVKILLHQENNRTWKNKFRESLYALALTWQLKKTDILLMYENTINLGGRSQGIKQIALDTFNLPVENLSQAQIFCLLSALNSPANTPLGSKINVELAKWQAKNLRVPIPDEEWENMNWQKNQYTIKSETAFELDSLNFSCQKKCNLTIDDNLTKQIRNILYKNLNSRGLNTASNGAVVVLNLRNNELLSIIGTPDINSELNGAKINMAIKPRAIGSTAKPLIYLKAFEKGARGYSLIKDEELKYQLATGFDFFPKNFDGKFRGLLTLHQSLDNSLNIPSVQVLEFVGLEEFYKFLKNDLGLKPTQALNNYQLGIALGALEIDPVSLAHFFTIFSHDGKFLPIKIVKSGFVNSPNLNLPMEKNQELKKSLVQKKYVELVNKILTDRDAGVDQFGIKSSLNLPFTNYAVKTGTSRDYHDSWTIGYSPDFLVAVWLGNSNNKPMKEITGLSGAAKVWQEVMTLMYNSEFNLNSSFNFSDIVDFSTEGTIEYGLKNDDFLKQQNILLRKDLILTPHNEDKYLWQENMTIPLTASQKVDWYINNKKVSQSDNYDLKPTSPGQYIISAQASGNNVKDNSKKESITIYINQQ